MRAQAFAVGVHFQVHGADDGGNTELARHQRRMARAPAAARDDTLRGEHPVNVVRACLGTHENHFPLELLRPMLRRVGVEHDLSDRGAGRDVEALREQRTVLARLRSRIGIELRVQEEIDVFGLDPLHRFFLRDEFLVGEVDREANRSERRALRVARLQHPEFAALDRELDVLHVAIVLFQPARNELQLLVDARHDARELGDRLRSPRAGDDVLALRIREEIAFELILAGGDVARRHHTRAGVVAHVPEDHGADVDRRPEIVGNGGGVAIIVSALPVPGAEHGHRRELELFQRVGRKGPLRMLFHDALEALRDLLEILRRQFRIVPHAALRAAIRQERFERLRRHIEDDRGIHLHETPIRVVDEALVFRHRDEPFRHFVVQSDIEHGVHHAGHRELGPRAARDEQRIAGIPEPLARLTLQGLHGIEHLIPHAWREAPARGQECIACLGRYGEAGRDR